MVIILTEDKESGFQFFKKVNEFVFQSKALVINTSYGSTDGKAGNSKFYSSITNMIHDNKIKRGDFLFIAVDRLIATSSNMVNELRAQNTQLLKCFKILKKHKIDFSISNYVCWEELLLSFEYLYEFCSIGGRNTDNKYIKQYLLHRKRLIRGIQSTDYFELFKQEIQEGFTIEQSIAKILASVTSDGEFNSFKVSKSSIGLCWYTDCSEAMPRLGTKQKKLCRECMAIKNKIMYNAKIGKSRMQFVYRHSLFRREFLKIYRMC